MDWTEIILFILSIATAAVAIANFTGGRKKDSKNEGEQEGALRSELQYIKELLLDVRTEAKETNKLLDDHSQRLAKFEEQLHSAFIRIERLEQQFDSKKGA